jgi:uncharacterized protein (UPF0332 family)
VIDGEFKPDIAKIFSNLFEKRENADYDIYTNFTEEEATNILKKAKLFIEESEKFL